MRTAGRGSRVNRFCGGFEPTSRRFDSINSDVPVEAITGYPTDLPYDNDLGIAGLDAGYRVADLPTFPEPSRQIEVWFQHF